ncbi:MAG: DUF1553 domain-containing protein, partial [SAR202 cluster bacterium]|nr:DUF1553 domain-containing protein [SAR202 cluster bacterium]
LPFDQFTIEQLAGDMLPQATQDQIIATGFHRNTLVNEEGGTDQEQFRVEAVVDRVNTTGAVWLGLTVGCAQCHTHKYDPITQREYYQLFALFNNADEPTLNFPNPEQAQRLAAFDAERKRTETELAEYERALRENQPAWEEIARRNLRVPWRLLDPDQFTAPAGMQLRKLADQSLLASGTVPENGNYTVTAPAGGRVTAVRLEVLTHPSLPSRGPGFVRGNFVLSEVELAAVGPDGQERKLVLDGAGADHSQTEYEVAMAVDGNAATGWAINVPAGMGRLNTDRTAVFLLQEPVELAAGSRLKITLKHEHPNRKYLIGRMRLAVAGAAREEVEFVVRPELRPLLLAESARRSAEEQKRVAEEYDRTDGRRARLRARLTGIEAQRKAFEKGVPSTLVLRERQEPRETFMHIRGDFLRKGSRVTPGVPEVLPPLPAAVTQPNRLDFVRWLVSDQNPLTPRVTVNRVWQALFGSGLVETENDFGKQGTAPTHPLLLDWLAARFRGRGLYTPAPARDRSGATAAPLPATNLGWSLKGLIRLLVTSATYRQASHARPDLVAVDPLNRLLGKQNRFRVEAEIIRDACLTASGLLSRKIGG